MTRLTTDDIILIADELEAYDDELVAKTGCTLSGIACQAAGVTESEIKKIIADARVGVVPITFGRGVIEGFSETVAGIVSHVGCKAFVTQAADVAGLAEAFEKNADIIMLSDDDRFVAIHLQSRQVIDNAAATGRGFAAGLSLMGGGLEKKNVLVVGCGPVGIAATQALVEQGSVVSIYDINASRSDDLSNKIRQLSDTKITIVKELDDALTDHQFIVDATPAAEIIRKHHISPQTCISAPGVPLGLDKEAQAEISNRLLHDPLQIGVATMIACAMKFRL